MSSFDATQLSTKNASPFSGFARWCSKAAGSPYAFTGAFAIVVLWALSGPLFGFSDTWQLVINTGTTVVTFLMVFVIQASQNLDTEAMQVKLDELIRSIGGARNSLLDLEELEEGEIERLREKYRDLASKARDRNGSGPNCPPART